MSHLLIKPGLGASCRDGYREGEKLFLGGSVSVSVIGLKANLCGYFVTP